MNTYLFIFLYVVFGFIFIRSVYEIGKVKGRIEAYKEEEEEDLKKYREKENDCWIKDFTKAARKIKNK